MQPLLPHHRTVIILFRTIQILHEIHIRIMEVTGHLLRFTIAQQATFVKEDRTKNKFPTVIYKYVILINVMIYVNRQAYKSQLKSRLYLIVFLHENGTKIALSAALRFSFLFFCFVNFYSHLFILLT